MENSSPDQENDKMEKSYVDKDIDFCDDDEALDALTLGPFIHLTTSPGKQLRIDLLKALEVWMPVPENKAAIIEEVIFMAHEMSLLLDDIQDYSALRRGLPAAHTIFGTTNVTIAFDHLLWLSEDKFWKLGKRSFVKMFLQTVKKGLQGQAMEIYWREKSICPTEEQYLEMVSKKTAAIFVTIARIVQEVSHSKVDVEKLISTIGINFQINDDLKNLTNETYHDSKGFCEDITEGKFSFPIIHAINNYPEEGAVIQNILRKRTANTEDKKCVLFLLKRCGSFNYTQNKINELNKIISQERAKLPHNSLIDNFIQKLSKFNVHSDYCNL